MLHCETTFLRTDENSREISYLRLPGRHGIYYFIMNASRMTPGPPRQCALDPTGLPIANSVYLASVAAFQSLEESALHILEQKSERINLAAGEILFNQGDPGDALYVVLCGTLHVEANLPDGSRRLLAKLGRGDCIGEGAVRLEFRRRSGS